MLAFGRRFFERDARAKGLKGPYTRRVRGEGLQGLHAAAAQGLQGLAAQDATCTEV